MNNKKTYQQPTTVATHIEPRTILCASMTINSNSKNGIWAN